MADRLYHRSGVSVRINRKQIEMSRDEHKSLWFTAEEWKEFLKAVKDGEFDIEYLDRFELPELPKGGIS